MAGAVVVLFGASIFVHEWGHYWIARMRGMKVEGFSIGFGPKIFGWRDKQGVDWAVRWIPFGGFVKLPQMITSQAIEGASSEAVRPASPWSRIWVSLAGPAMNVLFALVMAALIWKVGLPMLVNPPIVGYVAPDSHEATLGVREGDRIVSVEGRRVTTWEDVLHRTALALTNVVAVTLERDTETYTVQLPAEKNPYIGLKFLNLGPRDHPLVGEVLPDSAAAEAGLKTNDEFISFGGVAVIGQLQLIDLIKGRPDQATPVEIRRDGERIELEVTPRLDPETQAGRLGIHLTSSTLLTYEVQKPGPTPWQQIRRDLTLLRDTLSALTNRQSGVGAKDLAGPIAIAGMLATEMRVDFRRALRFLVFLNLNLALLNLLPLPVLDGGHILMALYELITRRPVDVRVQEAVTMVFALLLLSLMLYVTFNDVTKRIPLINSHLRQESVVEPVRKDLADPPTPVLSPAEIQ